MKANLAADYELLVTWHLYQMNWITSRFDQITQDQIFDKIAMDKSISIHINTYQKHINTYQKNINTNQKHINTYQKHINAYQKHINAYQCNKLAEALHLKQTTNCQG